jgi:hypothetical protein
MNGRRRIVRVVASKPRRCSFALRAWYSSAIVVVLVLTDTAAASSAERDRVGEKRGQGYVVDGGVDLFLARVDGSRRIRLTRTGRSSSPVWGRRGIAFSRVQPSGDAHFPIYELWMMRPRGGGAPTIDTSQPLSDRMVS